MKFGAVSLFSGAGGMDIGIRQAGFHVLAAIEADGNAAATLVAAQERERNGTKVVHADIRRVDPVRLMRRLGLEFGGLDLLFGGPPCQAFSLIGKQKGLADARGPLLFEVVLCRAILDYLLGWPF